MAPRKKRAAKAGIGAQGSCIARFLHPSAVIREKLPNDLKTRIQGFTIVGRGEKLIRKKARKCYLVTKSEQFPETTFHVAESNFKVEAPAPNGAVFDEEGTEVIEQPSTEEARVRTEEAQGVLTVADFRTGASLSSENVALIRNQDVQVDDDNEPVPENIPTETGGSSTGQIDRSIYPDGWGHDGICPRQAGGHPRRGPSFKNVGPEALQTMSHASLFYLLMPCDYIKEVLIPETNKKLDTPLTFGEYMVFVGLILLMSCFSGVQRHEWFSSSPIAINKGAPFRLNEFMSRNRMNKLMAAFEYTNRPVPTYTDRFFPVRQLIDAFNEHMGKIFLCAWVACLDESMMTWINQYTAPGWMVVPRKPHPFGNEFHTICCAICGILFAIELVEGKDAPRERGKPEFETLGKTVGLLLRLTRSIWHTATALVLDSGFCVVKGIVELRKKGVFAAALIKKRRYWPAKVQGDAIIEHFKDKDVGDTDALRGTFDNISFHIYAQKEPDYTTMIMSTYQTLAAVTSHKTRRKYKKDGEETTKEFCYAEPFSSHYRYRHQIDDHNNCRHSPISVETTWGTKHWPNRVHAFIIAMAEVNTRKAHEFFQNDKEPVAGLNFRKALAWELIHNTLDGQEEDLSPRRSKRRRMQHHELVKIPNFRGKFDGVRFKKVTTKWLQQRCGCGKRVRTYCRCNKGTILCATCFAEHLIEFR